MRCPSCLADISAPSSRCARCGAPLPVSNWATLSGVDPSPPTGALEFPPGHDFAGRYTIIERTGQGGMGVVYKAIDRRLDHAVALKLIQPALATEPEAIRRFKSEVLLARQISHPNVCRVHDLGESGGILYLTMGWIEGETLRRLLAQTRLLKPATALEIAEKVALALEAAHARQVVHRDLKPDNIMIDHGGEVFVMDFGLAVVSGTPAPSGTKRVVGTPPYLSPEQRHGEEADTRSDLYAMGLILWEMLTGRFPAPPPDAAAIRTSVPRPIAPLLVSVLAEDRARRCQSATLFLGALREVREHDPELLSGRPDHLSRWRPRFWQAATAAAFLAGALVVYVAVRPRRAAPGRQATAQTEVAAPAGLAVPSGGFFERGLHYLRDQGETSRGLGDAIQMLHRAVEKDPGDARAWATLGEAYWVRFRRTRDPDSKGEAASAVAHALELAPDLPEALHARGLGAVAAGDAAAALADFERAVAAEPGFDSAWESLGNAHRDLGNYAEGLRALQTALRLRPDSYLHQIAMGRFFERFAEYDAAATAYRRATDLKPDQAWGWNNLGAMYLFLARRPEEAVPAFERSLAIEDRGIARSNLGTAYFYQGKHQEALVQYRRATELEPAEADNWGNLGDALYVLGRGVEAHRAYERASGLARDEVVARPLDAAAHNQMAKYCAKAGNTACALAEGRRAAELQPDNPEIDFTNAVGRAAAGRADEAIDWLEKGVKHGLGRTQIEFEPFFAPLRGMERYRTLLARAV